MKNTHQLIIEKFTRVADDFQALIDQIPEGGMDWSEKEGEWSIRQIIHHLTDDGIVYIFAIERALAVTADKYTFGIFPGNNAWADQLKFDQRPVTPALKLIDAQRVFLAEMLEHFPDRWDNKIDFYDKDGKQVGSNTIEEMITMLTEHMQEHVETIEKILGIHQSD
ncbi:MAG: DinB family protein [Anaerolineales bacterium]